MNFEQRVTEPKLSKDGTKMVRTVKIGNRLLGTIESSKVKSSVAPGATFWTTSEVIQVCNGGNSLSVFRPRIANLAMYGVKNIGLRCTDGTSYSIALDKLQDELKTAGFEKYGRVLIAAWEVELPPEEVRVHNTMEKMRVGRRKSSVTVGS